MLNRKAPVKELETENMFNASGNNDSNELSDGRNSPEGHAYPVHIDSVHRLCYPRTGKVPSYWQRSYQGSH